VTKNYPDDERSRLDRPGTFRVNISAGKETVISSTGHEPREPASGDVDPSVTDTVFAHPRLRQRGLAGRGEPGLAN
jgi:Family of unknown function (DUF6194)